MKAKGLYEIHALIGHCHLHTKRKCAYSITLKMGSKVSASTEYRTPVNDELDFKTELILKIDKTLFEGPGKLSIIVTMLTEEKQKKIIGSAFANFKQKSLQTYRVSQCSCKDKGFEVSVEFEVVNIQNHNNNRDNNKFQSPNNSQMKDLKKALTVSREKQLVKSSRAKQSTATKSPAQKTQPKLNKQKIEKQLKQQLSPDLSSLTTKITPHSRQSNQQTKQIVAQLKDHIAQLEGKLKESMNKQKMSRKQVSLMQREIEMLKSQNQCLLELLKFQEEKSSAAITYIAFITQKIGQAQLLQNSFKQYLNLIQTIKKTPLSDTSSAIKQHNLQTKNTLEQYSFEFKPIQQEKQDNVERLEGEIQHEKRVIEDLRSKVIELQVEQGEYKENCEYLEGEMKKLQKENEKLMEDIKKYQKISIDFQYEKKTFAIANNKLTQMQAILLKSTSINENLTKQLTHLKHEHSLSQKLNTQLKQSIKQLEGQIKKLKEFKVKYEEAQIQNQRLKELIKRQEPVTPPESQIQVRKSRIQDNADKGQIENIIEEINGFMKKNNNHELLLKSRRIESEEDPEPFLARNKSQSLLKDLQDIQSHPKTSENSTQKSKDQQLTTPSSKKIQIPEHQKPVQRYSYEYDIDSLNYFNNFEQNHERMSESVGDDNTCEIDSDGHASPLKA